MILFPGTPRDCGLCLHNSSRHRHLLTFLSFGDVWSAISGFFRCVAARLGHQSESRVCCGRKYSTLFIYRYPICIYSYKPQKHIHKYRHCIHLCVSACGSLRLWSSSQPNYSWNKEGKNKTTHEHSEGLFVLMLHLGLHDQRYIEVYIY